MEAYQVVTTPHELRMAINARRQELGLTMRMLDDAAGLQEGYASKLLAPSRIKSFGAMSLPAVLGALGMKLVVAVEDEPHLMDESEPLGDLALSSLLGVLRLRLALVSDDATIPRMTRTILEGGHVRRRSEERRGYRQPPLAA